MPRHFNGIPHQKIQCFLLTSIKFSTTMPTFHKYRMETFTPFLSESSYNIPGHFICSQKNKGQYFNPLDTRKVNTWLHRQMI